MTESERIARFVEAVRDDPRVVGVARLRYGPPDVLELLVVTTWDGFESLPGELQRVGAASLAPGDLIERSATERWTGIDREGARTELALRRVGDLVPHEDAIEASVVHDPRGLVAQWIRVSRAADRQRLVETMRPTTAEDLTFSLDTSLRFLAAGSPGSIRTPEWSWRPVLERLRDGNAAEAALRARFEAALRASPLADEGLRVLPGESPSAAFESFLRTADDEGFKGDRVLFAAAVARLGEHAKRAPAFDVGFVLPTFDAVEAAFALGDAIGGCKPPLVPGVYVGVGVTPKDALEFWAAPFVRDPTVSVPCVDDGGEREIVERRAGSEAMSAAITSAADAAFDRLPALLDAARRAAKDSVDPAPLLQSLHLPRSFVERAKRHGAGALLCSRLTVALALARAGHGMAPLVARKLALAAGRVLAGR